MNNKGGMAAKPLSDGEPLGSGAEDMVEMGAHEAGRPSWTLRSAHRCSQSSREPRSDSGEWAFKGQSCRVKSRLMGGTELVRDYLRKWEDMRSTGVRGERVGKHPGGAVCWLQLLCFL